MKKILIAFSVAVLLAVGYLNFGFYTVQPIGMLPEGTTLFVSRKGQEPFFNSPDAMCLIVQNSVSLMCRIAAMGAAPKDRIIFRMSYQEWMYSISVDGRKFER